MSNAAGMADSPYTESVAAVGEELWIGGCAHAACEKTFHSGYA